MSLLTLVLLPVGACVGALLATPLLIKLLKRQQILDRPNARSSHEIPVPRGGGVAILLVTLPIWGLAVMQGATLSALHAPLAAATAGAILLGAVSWVDDIRGLSPLPRLIVQALGVCLGLAALPGEMLVLQGLAPFWLDRLFSGFAWLWFLNLYNFMDGIDGIAASETACIGFGIAVISLVGAVAPETGLLAATLAASAVGFLRWNWQPAKVFLGDVGSVPIGYLTGWLLLMVAAQGAWTVAVLLPLYFLADATITLLRRLLRGDRIWHAHREHYYQQAVRAGLTHAKVVLAMMCCNVVLVAMALAAATGPAWANWAALAGGATATTALLLWMGGGRLFGAPKQGAAR